MNWRMTICWMKSSSDPAVQARKAAQELLDQEVRAYEKYHLLLSDDRYRVISKYQGELRLTAEAEELIAESRATIGGVRDESEQS